MMRKLVVTLLAGVCLTSLAFANDEAVEKWSVHHPEASKALGLWVKAHPQAASRFFDWDAHHPERSQEFVTWTIEHPAERVGAFVRMHPNEPYLDEIMKVHHDAAEEFMVWCRNHAEAALGADGASQRPGVGRSSSLQGILEPGGSGQNSPRVGRLFVASAWSDIDGQLPRSMRL